MTSVPCTLSRYSLIPRTLALLSPSYPGCETGELPKASSSPGLASYRGRRLRATNFPHTMIGGCQPPLPPNKRLRYSSWSD